jgi:hypothetical protein
MHGHVARRCTICSVGPSIGYYDCPLGKVSQDNPTVRRTRQPDQGAAMACDALDRYILMYL